MKSQLKIGVHGRKFDQDSSTYILQTLEELLKRSCDIRLSPDFKKNCNHQLIDVTPFETYTSENIGHIDYLICLGGDGTLLEALTHVGKHEIPIMGINLGRLGFLATIAKKDISNALESFFNENFEIESRSLIHVDAEGDILGKLDFALNEVTILKKDTSSMIKIECFLNDQFLSSYWADGLMVATPTGSTGYSLSCGGPVIDPESKTFIITPVSPHNLSMRPIVVSDEGRISFKIINEERNFLISLDSRSYSTDNSINLSVSKEKFQAKLIKLQGYSFISTLRNKLNWGLDMRN